jgi:hypothetical protein
MTKSDHWIKPAVSSRRREALARFSVTWSSLANSATR